MDEGVGEYALLEGKTGEVGEGVVGEIEGLGVGGEVVDRSEGVVGGERPFLIRLNGGSDVRKKVGPCKIISRAVLAEGSVTESGKTGLSSRVPFWPSMSAALPACQRRLRSEFAFDRACFRRLCHGS